MPCCRRLMTPDVKLRRTIRSSRPRTPSVCREAMAFCQASLTSSWKFLSAMVRLRCRTCFPRARKVGLDDIHQDCSVSSTGQTRTSASNFSTSSMFGTGCSSNWQGGSPQRHCWHSCWGSPTVCSKPFT